MSTQSRVISIYISLHLIGCPSKEYVRKRERKGGEEIGILLSTETGHQLELTNETLLIEPPLLHSATKHE